MRAGPPLILLVASLSLPATPLLQAPPAGGRGRGGGGGPGGNLARPAWRGAGRPLSLLAGPLPWPAPPPVQAGPAAALLVTGGRIGAAAGRAWRRGVADLIVTGAKIFT